MGRFVPLGESSAHPLWHDLLRLGATITDVVWMQDGVLHDYKNPVVPENPGPLLLCTADLQNPVAYAGFGLACGAFPASMPIAVVDAGMERLDALFDRNGIDAVCIGADTGLRRISTVPPYMRMVGAFGTELLFLPDGAARKRIAGLALAVASGSMRYLVSGCTRTTGYLDFMDLISYMTCGTISLDGLDPDIVGYASAWWGARFSEEELASRYALCERSGAFGSDLDAVSSFTEDTARISSDIYTIWKHAGFGNGVHMNGYDGKRLSEQGPAEFLAYAFGEKLADSGVMAMVAAYAAGVPVADIFCG